MKLFKSLRNFFRLLIFKLTPAGRKKLMYEDALHNMKEAHTLSTLEKRILKSQVKFYVNRVLKRKRLSIFHLSTIVNKKFGEELAKGGMKWCENSYRVIDA